MRSNKHIDYYYKKSDLEALDDLENKQMEKYNDYGYNFGSTKRRVIDYDNHAKKVKYRVNQSFFNNK